MRASRQPNMQSHVRTLQTSNGPLMTVELGELVSLTFDFNFGDEQSKEVLFGVQFHYYSGDSLTNSTKNLLQEFMTETLGSSPDMPSQGGFSFVDTAEDLANDIIQSLLTDVAVDLDFAFGLNLDPMFDLSSSPDPFIQISQFDVSGVIGVNEWTSSLIFSDVEFAVAQAKALINITSALSSSPIRINSPPEFTALVYPPTEDSEQIIFEAGLDVAFPVFLLFNGIGFGAAIEYL